MNTSARLLALVIALAVVLAGAAVIGNAVGLIGSAEEPSDHAAHPDVSDAGSTPALDTGSAVKGLSASKDGYTLALARPTHSVGSQGPFVFTITGPDGEPVTRFTPTHDKDLHLIVVRRDTTGFQHLHPERDDTGRWSVPLTLSTAGAYKVFADFQPAGHDEALTLAADLSAPGEYRPQPLPAASRTATVDGYTITLDGELVEGEESKLTFTVTKNGQPVSDLQPYLAAYGHLVALRASDLAYLHVHPEGEPDDGRTAAGPDVTFYADVPSTGEYRLYMDFQHDGVVRTAEFTATAAGRGTVPPSEPGTPTPKRTGAEPVTDDQQGRVDQER